MNIIAAGVALAVMHAIRTLSSPQPEFAKRRTVLPITSAAKHDGISSAIRLAEEDIMTITATHQHRRLSRLAITAGAAVLAIGLLTTGSVLYTTNNASAVTIPTFSTFSRGVEAPVTLEIAWSPVIDTNSEFFFGTGDGSAGYYAERPNQ